MRRTPASRSWTGLATLAAALLCTAPSGRAMAARQPVLTHDDNVFAFTLFSTHGRPSYAMRLHTSGFGLDAKLRIRCLSGCALSYTDRVGAHLLGVMVLGRDAQGGAANLATWWATGSAGLLIIYRVSPIGVRRVLNAGLEGAPVFITDGIGGHEAVIIPDSQYAPAPGGGPRCPAREWRWSGETFQPAPTCHAALLGA